MLVIRMYCGADALMEVVRMSMLCKRPLLFLEAVRIKSAPCVLYRKVRMRMTRMTMRARCHCKMRATCSRREGSLHLLPIKIAYHDICFFKFKKIYVNISKIYCFARVPKRVGDQRKGKTNLVFISISKPNAKFPCFLLNLGNEKNPNLPLLPHCMKPKNPKLFLSFQNVYTLFSFNFGT